MSNITPAPQIRVWDRFVRVFHWSQAALIGAAWITSGELGRALRWKEGHAWIGYTIAALLAARIAWGFIGPRHARFSDFVRSPGVILGYLRDLIRGRSRRHLGHNPAGGAMILALIATVAATALTGWLQTTDMFWGSEIMEEIHGTFASLILWLVAAHLGGVIFESLHHRENLARGMITGMKRAPDRAPDHAPDAEPGA